MCRTTLIVYLVKLSIHVKILFGHSSIMFFVLLLTSGSVDSTLSCNYRCSSDCVCSASEMEMEEDTAASVSATETEDYPADEEDESMTEQMYSKVRLLGGMW